MGVMRVYEIKWENRDNNDIFGVRYESTEIKAKRSVRSMVKDGLNATYKQIEIPRKRLEFIDWLNRSM